MILTAKKLLKSLLTNTVLVLAIPHIFPVLSLVFRGGFEMKFFWVPYPQANQART